MNTALDLVTSLILPLCPSSLRGRRHSWGPLFSPEPHPPCTAKSCSSVVQRELNLVLACRARHGSLRLKNRGTEGLLSKPNSPFSLCRQPESLLPPELGRAASPQAGGVDQCRPPGLGGGCYWSASCFAPGKVSQGRAIKLHARRPSIATLTQPSTSSHRSQPSSRGDTGVRPFSKTSVIYFFFSDQKRTSSYPEAQRMGKMQAWQPHNIPYSSAAPSQEFPAADCPLSELLLSLGPLPGA